MLLQCVNPCAAIFYFCQASASKAREMPSANYARRALLSTPNSGQKVNTRPGSKLEPTPLLTTSSPKVGAFSSINNRQQVTAKG